MTKEEIGMTNQKEIGMTNQKEIGMTNQRKSKWETGQGT
jgi:hypothetical protein